MSINDGQYIDLSSDDAHDTNDSNDRISENQIENENQPEKSASDWRDEDFLSFTNLASPSYKNQLKLDSEPITGTADPVPLHTGPVPWSLIDTNNFITTGINGDMFYKQNGIYRKMSPLVLLHNEIINFVTLMSPLPDEIHQRESLVHLLKTFITNLFPPTKDNKTITISVFGSQATRLLLPASDIDLVVCFSSVQEEKSSEENSTSNNNNNPLIVMYEAFREADPWKDELTYLELILESRVPILKLTHAPTGLSVDISLDQPLGPQTAALCLRYIHALPPLRYLTMVLKYFLQARGLNEPFSGGMGSYALFLMIASFLQHREREENQRCRRFSKQESGMNLGALLLDFFELYGFDFNYITTAISIRHDGHYFPKGAKDRQEYFWTAGKPFTCGIENPLDTTMDVGKPTFRISVVQRSFEAAFRILLARVSDPLPLAVSQQKMLQEDDVTNRRDGSILSSILPPTEEMKQRVPKVLEALRSTPEYLNYKGTGDVETDGRVNHVKQSGPSRSNSDMSVSSPGSSRSEPRRSDHYKKRSRDDDRDYPRRKNVR